MSLTYVPTSLSTVSKQVMIRQTTQTWYD